MEAETEGWGNSSSETPKKLQVSPSVAEMQKRAVAKFTNDSNVMVDSCMGPVDCDSVNNIWDAIQAINNTWDVHEANICQSPERPDLNISKEEGIGWILAEMLFDRELLIEEARSLGKRAGK